jgi:hypothetical protein
MGCLKLSAPLRALCGAYMFGTNGRATTGVTPPVGLLNPSFY